MPNTAWYWYWYECHFKYSSLTLPGVFPKKKSASESKPQSSQAQSRSNLCQELPLASPSSPSSSIHDPWRPDQQCQGAGHGPEGFEDILLRLPLLQPAKAAWNVPPKKLSCEWGRSSAESIWIRQWDNHPRLRQMIRTVKRQRCFVHCPVQSVKARQKSSSNSEQWQWQTAGYNNQSQSPRSQA